MVKFGLDEKHTVALIGAHTLEEQNLRVVDIITLGKVALIYLRLRTLNCCRP
jgi:hypothetical protein